MKTEEEIRELADYKCTLPSTSLCVCNACDKADKILEVINEVLNGN